jgi:AraC-like DNA-binding protein
MLKTFKRSPQQWLNIKRLEAAGKLLQRERSVKVVAIDLGFKQLSHFSREFKVQYGLAPTEFLTLHGEQRAKALRNRGRLQ